MVSYQVDDINQTFDDINLLKKNNWEIAPSDQPPVSNVLKVIDELVHLTPSLSLCTNRKFNQRRVRHERLALIKLLLILLLNLHLQSHRPVMRQKRPLRVMLNAANV